MKLNSPFHLQHLRLNLDRFSLLHPPGKILKNKIKFVNKRALSLHTATFLKKETKINKKKLTQKGNSM